MAVAGTKKAATAPKTMDIPSGKLYESNRNPPPYIFTRTPTALLNSYYDYMIGSYNNLPLQVIPTSSGGGYFMTYHGSRSPTSQRRVFYSCLDASGNTIYNNEIPLIPNNEGYPALDVDPVSGKPLYFWHEDTDNDGDLEILFTSDAFIAGIADLFNTEQVIMDPPFTVSLPEGSFTIENIAWPSAVIGPSPIPNKRRIYVSARSESTQGGILTRAYVIAYADFNGDMIENGTPFEWSYTTIPELFQWNNNGIVRMPNLAMTADNYGNLYLCGYHMATELDGSTDVIEPDMDVFKCPNFGMGTWSRVSASSHLPSWNPPASPTGTAGYFVDEDGIPYADNELWWQLMHSEHMNATIDDNGRIHVPGLWGLTNVDGFFYPDMQYVKEFVFNPSGAPGNQFTIKEIYPQKSPVNFIDEYYQPWDLQAPWGVVDSWTENVSGWAPDIATDWNFPHWDMTLHGDAMMYHYNNIKITENDGHGLMAVVWQNSYRAKLAHEGDSDYNAFLNTPEIYISVSQDSGQSWQDPIVLNNVDTPQLAGLKPMWVYPADHMIFIAEGECGRKIGKLGLMLYDDNTWGSFAITPSAHPTNDGGRVMFMELRIGGDVGNPPEGSPEVPTSLLGAHPNPFVGSSTIQINVAKNEPNLKVEIYNLRGQKVKTLHNGFQASGLHELVWNATNENGTSVSSGIYFLSMNIDGKPEKSRRLVLLK